MGVPGTAIVLQQHSLNTGENFRFPFEKMRAPAQYRLHATDRGNEAQWGMSGEGDRGSQHTGFCRSLGNVSSDDI
jgi:hypothetical protein